MTGEWSDLAFPSDRVDREVLARYTPDGTEPDRWPGECYLSAVGMHVRDLRIAGAPRGVRRRAARAAGLR